MPPGCLLIHGFTATPHCLESLKTPFIQAGWKVETPLLAGHGQSFRDLDKITRHDWWTSVETSFEKLATEADPIYVAGLSLGSLLTLKLAHQFPQTIKAIACLAPPLFFTDPKVQKGIAFLRKLPFRTLYHRYAIKKEDPAAIKDPIARQQFIGYGKFSLKSLFEVWDLKEEVFGWLSEIQQPTLVMTSRDDTVVSPKSASYLKKHLGSSVIEDVVLTNSNHVLTMDYEKDVVQKSVFNFFQI